MKIDRGNYLDDSEVERVIQEAPYPEFVRTLLDELKKAYLDKSIKISPRRLVWQELHDTTELMIGVAPGLKVAKIISSQPSQFGRGAETVTGSYHVQIEQPPYSFVCDARALTHLRTAVGTTVVAQIIRPEATSLGIIGCGELGTTHALVLPELMPSIQHIFLSDRLAFQSHRAKERILNSVGGSREVVDLGYDNNTAASADIVVTATYGLDRQSVLERRALRENCLIAAVGSDLPGKKELNDGENIYWDAKFIADDPRQCLKEGELEYAKILFGYLPDFDFKKGYGAEGRVISTARLLEAPQAFLEIPEPITIYDSSGTSIQDLAAVKTFLRYSHII